MADGADGAGTGLLPDYRYVDGEAHYGPGIAAWERVRRALQAAPEEWVRVRILHTPGGPTMRLRTDARSVEVTLAQDQVDDVDYDLWPFVQDEVERLTRAVLGSDDGR
jgi:hypothetical protein